MKNPHNNLQGTVDKLQADCGRARLIVSDPGHALVLERAETELAKLRRQLEPSASPFGLSTTEVLARLGRVRDVVAPHLARLTTTEHLKVDLKPADAMRTPADLLGFETAARSDSWRHPALEPTQAAAPMYRYRNQRFHPSDGGTPLVPDQAYTDDLVVAGGSSGSFRPLWLLPDAPQMPRAWKSTWSARLAASVGKSEFIQALRTLEPRELETALETLPDAWVHELTGESWDAVRASLVAETSLGRFLQALKRQGYAAKVVPGRRSGPLAIEELHLIDANPPVRDGVTVPLEALALSPAVERALRAGANLETPYVHQALATALLRRGILDGTDLVLSTPTASGKTYAFLPAILDALHASQGARTMLVLHPLKALSLDQAKKLRSINDQGLGLQIAEFFGNASREALYAAEGRPADVVLGTPDKLNYHLDKPELQDILRRAQFLVLDEAHVYRSHFGANMALFLRRLLAMMPDDLRIIVVSATLGNTVEFASTLTGRQRFRVVGASSAPVHARFHYLPISRSEASPQRKQSPKTQILRTIAKNLKNATSHGITFVQARPEAASYAKALAPHAVSLVSGQRDYREIVQALQRGELRHAMVVATTTLEAGIDIGDLTTVALSGFPRNRNSFRQMAGRAGRNGPADIVFFPGRSVADAYYGRPENFDALVRSLEADPVLLHPWNPNLVVAHALRYQYEKGMSRPMSADQLRGWLGDPPASHVSWPELHERLVRDEANHRGMPAVPNLRGTFDVPYVVRLRNQQNEHADSTLPATLVVPDEGLPPDVIEEAAVRVAYREWGIGNTALRADRYYEVQDWTLGGIQRGHYRRDAVFVWVQDVTATMRVDPDDDPTLPPAAHHTNVIEVAPHMDVVHRSWDLGSIAAHAGVGEVTQALTGKRQHHELTWTFVCPRWRRSRGVSLTEQKRTAPFLDIASYTPYEGGPWQPLAAKDAKHGRARIEHDNGFVQELVVKELLRSEDQSTSWHVELHEHSGTTPGTCSCGAATEMRRDILVSTEEAPVRDADHAVYQARFGTIRTDMALAILDGDNPRALAAVAKAMTKVLPDVLSIDRDDVGAVARFAEGRLHLWLFDTIDGGAGLAPRIFDHAPRLFAEARRVLETSRTCSCEGNGCLGCFETSPTLVVVGPSPYQRSGTHQAQNETAEPWLSANADAGLRFLDQLLDSWTWKEIADPRAVESDDDATGTDSEVTTSSSARLVPDPPDAPIPSHITHSISVAQSHSTQAPPSVPSIGETPYFRHLIVDARLFQESDPASGPVAEALLRDASRLRVDLLQPPRGAVTPNAPPLTPEAAEAWSNALRSDYAPRVADAAVNPGPVLIAIADCDLLPQLGDHLGGAIVALRGWGANAGDAIAWGPDLVLAQLIDLVEAVNSPLPFYFPLEQAGRHPHRRSSPPRVRINGFETYVLARYAPRKGGSRDDTDHLNNVSEHLEALLRSGTGARPVASYLHEMWPAHAVATLATPNSGGRGTHMNGLELVAEGLRRLGHEVTPIDAAHGSSAHILLLDGILDGASQLRAATQRLEPAGAQVVPVALAFPVQRRHGSPSQEAP